MENGRDISAHRDLMQSPVLQKGLDYAMLEYQGRLAAQTEPPLAATAHFKLTGVLEFIHVLKTLAESPKESNLKIVDDNLNHRA